MGSEQRGNMGKRHFFFCVQLTLVQIPNPHLVSQALLGVAHSMFV